MIKPICNICKKELEEFGAILLSPPDEEGRVKKYHLCRECYKGLGVEDMILDKIKLSKQMGEKTREIEKQGGFNNYPRGMKNEVIAHFQNGFIQGALWAEKELGGQNEI